MGDNEDGDEYVEPKRSTIFFSYRLKKRIFHGKSINQKEKEIQLNLWKIYIELKNRVGKTLKKPQTNYLLEQLQIQLNYL